MPSQLAELPDIDEEDVADRDGENEEAHEAVDAVAQQEACAQRGEGQHGPHHGDGHRTEAIPHPPRGLEPDSRESRHGKHRLGLGREIRRCRRVIFRPPVAMASTRMSARKSAPIPARPAQASPRSRSLRSPRARRRGRGIRDFFAGPPGSGSRHPERASRSRNCQGCGT